MLHQIAGMVLFGQTAVTMDHYDQTRSGTNQSETALTPQSVNAQSFGRLGVLQVSGCVVSQPLYVPGINIPGYGTKNVVYVATSTNQVYAFDADDFTLYVSRLLADPVPSAEIDPNAAYNDFPDCDGADQQGPVGVSGTPVIDLNEQALYVAAAVLDDSTGLQEAMLYKLDLGTLEDLVAPVQIAAENQGDVFDARYQLQRAGLLLANGQIYIAFSSHQDEIPYRGWLFSYDDQLNQTAVYNYSPQKSGTGIWQSGGGPAWDGAYIYLTTGNAAEGIDGPGDYEDSILQLDPVTLEVVAKTSFPNEDNNWDTSADLDLGSSRVVPLPGLPFAVSGSKYGDMFVVNLSDMSAASRFQAAARHSSGFDWTGIYNGLAFWNNTLYVWPGGGGTSFNPTFPTDVLKAYAVASDGSVHQVASGQSDGVGLGYQGAGLAISSNGSDPSSGIVWAMTPTDNGAWLRPGVLRAYAASSTAIFQQLWSDADAATGDGGYYWAKFNQPLVANGRVYTPTFSGEVVVYGLFVPPPPPPNIQSTGGPPAAPCRLQPESTLKPGTTSARSSCKGSSPP
jgi:hypothetical protein